MNLLVGPAVDPETRRFGAVPENSPGAAMSIDEPRAAMPEPAPAARARQLEAILSAIPDYVYAFDRRRRFTYANPAMSGLFGLSAETMLGKTFADLDYPAQLAERLNGHIDGVLNGGPPIEDEVFFRSPTGHAAYFSFLWGPAYADDGSIELVVGVSRDTSERRAVEEALRRSQDRLRAATELVGLAIYAWDPVTGALEWDDRLRAMWGLPAGAAVDMAVFEAGIHPDDRARVREAIAACVDPAGEGRYDVEYRVIGRDDGVTRRLATSGRTSFAEGRAVGFIGAVMDLTAQRNAEAAIRASEAQFRSFADHSNNLIWIADFVAGAIVYRSAAYERIWGWRTSIPTTGSSSNTLSRPSGPARPPSTSTGLSGPLTAPSAGFGRRASRSPRRRRDHPRRRDHRRPDPG
jgi:PAS domain S-box-containing protein